MWILRGFEFVTAILTDTKTEIATPVQFHISDFVTWNGNLVFKTNFTELPILIVNYKDAVHIST